MVRVFPLREKVFPPYHELFPLHKPDNDEEEDSQTSVRCIDVFMGSSVVTQGDDQHGRVQFDNGHSNSVQHIRNRHLKILCGAVGRLHFRVRAHHLHCHLSS
jgi:hypothetical protein